MLYEKCNILSESSGCFDRVSEICRLVRNGQIYKAIDASYELHLQSRNLKCINDTVVVSAGLINLEHWFNHGSLEFEQYDRLRQKYIRQLLCSLGSLVKH